MSWRWFMVLLCAVLGCSGEAAPRPQWTVSVVTDAPVPQFGDRVLVEVIAADGSICAACRRQFGIAPDTKWPLSFGVVPFDTSSSVRVRARLYRSIYTGADGLPSGASVIDALGLLPVPTGDMHVSLTLSMRCFARPADLATKTSCNPRSGSVGSAPVLADDEGQSPIAGSWEPAKVVACPAGAPSDMVCVPGGAFLLGDPRFVASSDAAAAVPERLVKLAPFALDRDEVTVGTVRRLVQDGTLAVEPLQRPKDAGALNAACTYLGRSNPADDALPVNCVSYELAAAACAALHKRLPTEAEWEFASGNTTSETTYPWGDDDTDMCQWAIVGRGRIFPTDGTDPEIAGETSVCRAAGSGGVLPAGPVAGGAATDKTELGISNLGGSLSEWVADSFAPYIDGCWSSASPLVNPRCELPGGRHSLRGASWATSRQLARAAERNASGSADPYEGFRCATSW